MDEYLTNLEGLIAGARWLLRGARWVGLVIAGAALFALAVAGLGERVGRGGQG